MNGFSSVKAYQEALIVQMAVSSCVGIRYCFSDGALLPFCFFAYCALCALMLFGTHEKRSTQ